MPIKIHKNKDCFSQISKQTKNELGFLEKLWICLLEETLIAAHPDERERERERETERQTDTERPLKLIERNLFIF